MRRPRRRWRWVLLGLSVGLVALYLAREAVVHPPLARLASRLATSDGLRVSIQDIDGDWFSELGVRGVTVSQPAGPLADARVDRAAVAIDFGALVRGRWLEALEAVELEGARIAIDLTRAPAGPDGEPAASWAASPGALPALAVTDLSLSLKISETTALELTGLGARSRGSARDRVVDLHAKQARLTLGDREWRGSGTTRLRATPDEVHMAGLTFGGERLVREARLDWSRLAAKAIGWEANLLGSEIETRGAWESGALAGSVRATDLDLSRAGALLPRDASPLAGRVDGSLEYSTDAELGVQANVDLDATALRFGGETLGYLAVSARYADGVALVRHALAEQGSANRLEIGDLRLPVPWGSTRELLNTLQGGVAFELHDLERVPFLPLEDIPDHSITGAGRIAEGRIELDRGQLVFAGGAVRLERGLLDMDPEHGDPNRIEIDALVDIASLESFGQLLGADDYTGSLSGRANLEGTLERLSGHVEFVGSDVRVFELPLGEVDVFAHAAEGLIQVDRLECDGPLGSIGATGVVDVAERRLGETTVSATIQDARPLVERGWVPAELVELLDPVTVSAWLEGPWDGLSGEAEVTSGRARIGGELVESLRIDAALEAEAVRLEALQASSPRGNVRAKGALRFPAGEDLEASLAELAFERGESRLELTELVLARFGAETLSIGALRLAGSAGELTLQATRAGSDWRAAATTKGLEVSELVPELPLTVGAVDLALDFERTAETTRIVTSGRAAQLIALESLEALELDWDLELSDGRATLTQLQLARSGLEVLSAEGEVPLDPFAEDALPAGPVRLSVSLDAPPEWTRLVSLPEAFGTLSTVANGQVELAGTWEALTGSARFAAQDLSMDGPEVNAWFNSPAQLGVDIELGERVRATASGEFPEFASLQFEGTVERGLDLRAWLRDAGAALERWSTVPVQGRARAEIGSLATLTQHVDEIRRLDGIVTAEAELSGELGDPRLSGRAQLTDGELKLVSSVPSLRKLVADLTFDEQSVVLEGVRAEMGAAPVEVSGTVDWGEGPLALDLRVRGEEALLVRSASERLRADTDLRITGPVAQLHVAGSLGLRSSRVSQNIDLIPRVSNFSAGEAVRADSRGFQFFSFRDPPLADMTLDLQIRTLEPLILSTNVASSRWTIDLGLRGTGRVPLPEGQIFMEETRVKLPAGILTFDSGRVAFLRQNPFVPRIEMRGETRLAGYDVTVTIEGPYDQPEVILSSSPPLREGELFLLVITGEVPQSSLSSSSQRAAQSITLYLAKDIFQRWSASGLDDGESLFDRLEVIQGRNVSKSGVQTTEVSFALDGERSYYLVGERDVFEDYNFGLRVVFRFE